ncbi:MAG: cellulase family glycosylhydrolase [Bacteroidales bacterium]|nr:cellulase family glycosylhydrolase [Bacteroidales bacterium]
MNNNPKIILFLVIILYFANMNFAQNVTIEGKKFKIGDEDFYPVVINYLVAYVYNDDETEFVFSPIIDVDGWGYECNNQINCLEQMRKNLQQTKNMGFNSVRIVHFEITFNDNQNFCIMGKNETYGKKHFELSSDFSDIHSQNLFSFYKSFLNLAYEEDIKVIILCGGNGSLEHTQEFHEAYPNYLTALGSYIHNNCTDQEKSALLAYDLLNEPLTNNQVALWPQSNAPYHKKSYICQSVTNWYDCLKASDPNHLITLGGQGFFDVFEWDLNILKLDFYSPHIYPGLASYLDETFRYQNQEDLVNGYIYWIGKNSPMPWIIGEIGYGANTDLFTDPITTNGTLNNQKDFAHETLKSVVENGGSGYSWWVYSNLSWGNRCSSYGLLNPGLCEPIPCTSLEKPLVEEFRNFNPVNYSYNPQKPSNYYNPHYYDLSGVNLNSQTIEGTVVDENGNPIEDAVVFCQTSGGYFQHYTFTNEEGQFTVLPFDENDPLNPSNGSIVNLKISTAGAERGIWGSSRPDDQGPVIDNAVYVIKQNKFEYNLNSDNQVINESNSELLKAWNSISANNLTVSSGVSGEVKARSEINLTGETHLVAGSELRLYNTNVFADCACFMGDFRSSENTVVLNDLVSKSSTGNISKNIEAVFQHIPGEILVKVFPNPAKTEIKIEISGIELLQEEYTVLIYNSLGKTTKTLTLNITANTINIENFETGVYYISVQGKDFLKQTKLIKF